jgi:hypothetical protein
MLLWTTISSGLSFGLIVHHTDAEREYAYDRNSSFGRLDKALDAADTPHPPQPAGTFSILRRPAGPIPRHHLTHLVELFLSQRFEVRVGTQSLSDEVNPSDEARESGAVIFGLGKLEGALDALQAREYGCHRHQATLA